MGEALSRAALVTEHSQIPVGGAQGVADPSECEQPSIRVGLVGKPAQHDRQQGSLDRSSPTEPAGQSFKMAHRPRRVAKAQRGQTFTGGLRGQPRLGAAESGSCDQQRTVEEPLMDSSHLTRLLLPLGDHGRARITAMADGPSEAPQVRLGGRHEMGPPQLEELDPVLEGTQKSIRLVQNCRVLARDVPATGQRGQSLQSRT